jgi:hypothetical protein
VDASASEFSPHVTNSRFLSIRAPLLAAGLLHLALAAAAWVTGPGLNSDSATGFLLWDAWRAGFPWNHQVYPDPANLAHNLSLFQAWWSPGQYLAVAPLQWFGLNLGQAISVGSFGWTLFGLAGWWRLFRAYKLDEVIAAWSVLVIACNWTLVRNYGDYMGGDMILLGLAPWLMLGLRVAVKSRHLLPWAIAPGLVWLGLMAKNTFLPTAGGVLLAAQWPGLIAAKGWRRLLHLGAIISVMLAGYGLYWLTFLRHGWHPGSGGLGGLSTDAGLNLARLAGFPLGGLVSLQNLLGRIFLHPPTPLAAGWAELAAWLVPISLGLAAATVWLIRRELQLRRDYGRLLLFITAGSLAFFAVFAVTRDALGLEERFLRPCSFLFAPAVLYTLRSRVSWLIRAPLGGLLALGLCYGAASGPLRAFHLWRLDARGDRGISQTSLGKAGLAELLHINRTAPAGTLVVVTSPEIALDLTRVRFWATHLEMMPLESVAPYPLRGRVPLLIVVSGPGSRTAGQPPLLLSRFTDYDPAGWRQQRFGDWIFYTQGILPQKAP